MEDELAAAREVLREHGVADEVVETASGNEVFRLAYEQYLWGGPPTMTAAEMGARVGFDDTTVRRLWVRLGYPDPEERTVFRAADEITFRLAHAGTELFGMEEIEAFSLVVGMAVRKITDAASALSVARLDEMGLTLTQRLEQGSVATTLLRSVAEDMLPTLLLHDLQSALEFGADLAVDGGGQLSVGFCDLSGSTMLLNSADARGVLDSLAQFQIAANEVVVQHRGQLVKFVGDEVMFTVAAPAGAIAIGRDLVTWVDENPKLDSARVGCAVGDVIQRDGDVFGPTVNRAARFVALASPGSLLVDAAMTDEGVEEQVDVRGFPDPVPVRGLTVP
jgi:adenylate cyclase